MIRRISPARKKLWARSLLWLAFLAPFFFLTYGQVNIHTATLPEVGAIVFAWEKHIPFWPWTIVPYWSIDFFYGLSLFLCTTPRELTVHGLRLVTASLAACIGFLLFPLRFSFTRPVSDGMFGWLFQQLELFDLPFNQAPSLHIILLWLLWLRFYAHLPRRWHWLLHSWSVLIGLSVLTTWQHHFIDIITGFAVGVVISYLLPVYFQWHWQYRADLHRRALAIRYCFGSIVCIAAACLLQGYGWLLLWPGFALLMVALAYLGLGTSIFQKNRQGCISISARIVLMPYQLGAWLSFLYFRRKASAMSEITPGLYLGSFPLQKSAGLAVLDMTCEWPRSRQTRHVAYVACPRLDLVAPDITEIEESVHALSALPQPVLIHCALGLSRSAIVMIAWLVKQQHAKSLAQAITIVQQARPEIVIHRGHMAALQQWQQHYLKESYYA